EPDLIASESALIVMFPPSPDPFVPAAMLPNELSVTESASMVTSPPLPAATVLALIAPPDPISTEPASMVTPPPLPAATVLALIAPPDPISTEPAGPAWIAIWPASPFPDVQTSTTEFLRGLEPSTTSRFAVMRRLPASAGRSGSPIFDGHKTQI